MGAGDFKSTGFRVTLSCKRSSALRPFYCTETLCFISQCFMPAICLKLQHPHTAVHRFKFNILTRCWKAISRPRGKNLSVGFSLKFKLFSSLLVARRNDLSGSIQHR